MTLAVAGVPLLQVPPVAVVGVTLKETVAPWHIDTGVGVRAVALAPTVTVAEIEQEPTPYVIIAEPPLTPVTTPLALLANEATEVVPLVHVPPIVGSVNVMVEVAHTEKLVAAAIAEGVVANVNVPAEEGVPELVGAVPHVKGTVVECVKLETATVCPEVAVAVVLATMKKYVFPVVVVYDAVIVCVPAAVAVIEPTNTAVPVPGQVPDV